MVIRREPGDNQIHISPVWLSSTSLHIPSPSVSKTNPRSGVTIFTSAHVCPLSLVTGSTRAVRSSGRGRNDFTEMFCARSAPCISISTNSSNTFLAILLYPLFINNEVLVLNSPLFCFRTSILKGKNHFPEESILFDRRHLPQKMIVISYLFIQ